MRDSEIIETAIRHVSKSLKKRRPWDTSVIVMLDELADQIAWLNQPVISPADGKTP